MNSSITSISEILNNSQGFFSEGFSAGYNYDAIKAASYFDDLLEKSDYPSPIFSGILIMKQDENKFTIVDGLQRVTTICLLLCALCENYKNTSDVNAKASEKIFNRYLIHNGAAKLKLSGEDKFIYKKILFSERLTEKEEKSNLVLAYKSFLQKIRERKILGTELFGIISKIQFMIVLVDPSQVSPRELYQSINGNDKSQINLISDFIYSTKDDEVKRLWNEAIESIRSLGLIEVFEDFMRDFLVVQNEGRTPDRNAIYQNFKNYFNKMSKYVPASTIIRNVVKYSRYYFKIFKADFEDEEIKSQICTLNEHNGRDAYPFLMEVLEDLESSHIERDLFVELLTALNIFVKNKYDNPQSAPDIDFTTLSAELTKMLMAKAPEAPQGDEDKLTINKMNNLPIFGV